MSPSKKSESEKSEQSFRKKKHQEIVKIRKTNQKNGSYLPPIHVKNDPNATHVYQEGTYAKEVLDLNQKYRDLMNYEAAKMDGNTIDGGRTRRYRKKRNNRRNKTVKKT